MSTEIFIEKYFYIFYPAKWDDIYLIFLKVAENTKKYLSNKQLLFENLKWDLTKYLEDILEENTLEESPSLPQ